MILINKEWIADYLSYKHRDNKHVKKYRNATDKLH